MTPEQQLQEYKLIMMSALDVSFKLLQHESTSTEDKISTTDVLNKASEIAATIINQINNTRQPTVDDSKEPSVPTKGKKKVKQ